VRAAIERRIQEFLTDGDPRLTWVRPAVRRDPFLPLYVGWVAALGIRPDGSFVCWNHDQGGDVEALTDPFLKRMALCQGAKMYPELAALIPERPEGAAGCPFCKGTGEFAGTAKIVCACGGLGWLVPGEARGPGPA
jgi:hypothetical protein